MAYGGYFEFMQISFIYNWFRLYESKFHTYFGQMSSIKYYFKCFMAAILKNRHCAESTHGKLGDFLYTHLQYIWDLLWKMKLFLGWTLMLQD